MTSFRVDKLSLGGEVFYRRLMSKVDDYGRYDAHPVLLVSACFPTRVDTVKPKDVEKWLAECMAAELLHVYEVNKKMYLQLIDWKQQIRTDSKFPAPDEQMLSKCTSTVHLVVGEGEGEGGAKASPPRGLAIQPPTIKDSVWKDFISIRKAKRAPLTQTALNGIEKEATKAGISLEAALETCCKRGWQSFEADWISATKTQDRSKVAL